MNKIFQIGFNKCATTSLYELFTEYSYPKLKTIHWDNGRLAYSMYQNMQKDTPLLELYKEIDYYGDMECNIGTGTNTKLFFGFKYFHILDQQYPNSKFILNTRNIENWISSRLKHYTEFYIQDGKVEVFPKPIEYYKKHMLAYQLNDQSEIIDRWRYQWISHHSNVIKYFKNRPNDLLVFDIEKDTFPKISDFFGKFGIKFTTNDLPHSNKTQVST